MLRPRLETALAVFFAFLMIVTLSYPNWIESLTGFEPDASSGDAEWGSVVFFGVLALVVSLLARRDYGLAALRGRMSSN